MRYYNNKQSPSVVFAYFIPVIAVNTFVSVKTSSSPKCSPLVLLESMPLQDLKDLQSILSIVKGFHLYP